MARDNKAIIAALEESKQLIVAAIKERGHVLTGNLISEISYEVKYFGNVTVGRMYMPTYGFYVEFGVRPERIPYTIPNGATRKGASGRRSKYIDGLISYFTKRGLQDDEAKRAAFATARVHKREGMSTVASARFSKVGKRNGFVAASQPAIEEIAGRALENYGFEIVEAVFAKADFEKQRVEL